MEKIVSYISLIESTLKKVSGPKNPKELYSPITYTYKLGGKRIRPALLMLSNNLFGGKDEDAINAALAIEVFHNFTLLHDDIMDDAPLRRGKETVYKKWGKDIAILSGDVMLVNAYQHLSKCKEACLAELLSLFNATAVHVCEGQQYDMNFENESNVCIDDYLKMIELKTAVLLACSLKMGAIIGGASKDDANYMYEFGRNLGVAFQLMDDILDLYGDPKKVGKQVGGDIISNKKTYLLLKAQELATGDLKKQLEFALTSKALKKEDKIEKVRVIFDKLKIKAFAEKEMTIFYNTALANLDSIDADTNKKLVFESFAKSLMQREN